MTAWIFDIDGVIVNFNTKKVEYPQILQKISNILERNEPVALISGRSISKVLDMVIEPIENLIKQKDKLDLLTFEGEFGAVSLKYTKNKQEINYDTEYSPPDELISEGKKISEEFSDYVFFDLKKTFFTGEIKNGVSNDSFKSVQPKIKEKLQKLIDDMSLSDLFEVHQDNNAVNVKNKKLNKHLATQKFLDWQNTKKINPEIYIVFGDSESDLQIGQELYDQGKNLEFIYTGEDEIEEKPFKIIKVGKFDLGTLEYLQ